MDRTPRRISPATVVAVTLLASSTAFAGSSFDLPAWGEARSTTVRYADLDLATPTGVRTLQQRIARAVDRVCSLPHAEQLAQLQRVAACRAEARSQADQRAAQLLRKADAVARTQ